jgi:exosortase E/protease (VPEID-CTERM system)
LAETVSSAWGRRGVVLVAILAAEVLVLSFHFDIAISKNNPRWLVWTVDNSDDFLRIGISFAGLALIVLAPHLRNLSIELHRLKNPLGTIWLLAHLLSFGIFFFLTERLLESPDGSFHVPIAWFIFWIVVVATTIVFWLLSLAPIQFWGTLVKKKSMALQLAGFTAIAAWTGGVLIQQLWRPLAEITFWLTRLLLKSILPSVTSDAKEGMLGTPTFQVLIAPECSGYEGISLITVFVAVYIWVFRNELRFPQSLLLFPIGILAIYVANVIRLAALILFGTYVSPDAAVSGFHSQAGWIAFNVIAVGIIAVAHRTAFFSAAYRELPVPSKNHLATALLVPFFAMMAAAMLTKAFSAAFNVFYPLQVIVTAAVLWYFRKTYSRLSWEWSYHAVAIGIVVFFMWILLEPAPEYSRSHVEVGLAERHYWVEATWILFRVIGTVITVPLAEELAFRGYLTRKLISPDFENIAPGQFTWFSFLLSSILFGLMHSRLVAGTIAGMLFAVALYRRGQFGDAVVAHMTANALIAAYVLMYGRWALWT